MFLICTVPLENVQSCKEPFVLPLFNVLDVLEFYTLSLVTAALTQRVILILPKKQLLSVPFQTYQESWRSAVIQIEQVSQTEIRFINKYAISIKLSLSFVVNKKETYTCNNNPRGSWELLKHSSVCELYRVHNGRVTWYMPHVWVNQKCTDSTCWILAPTTASLVSSSIFT